MLGAWVFLLFFAAALNQLSAWPGLFPAPRHPLPLPSRPAFPLPRDSQPHRAARHRPIPQLPSGADLCRAVVQRACPSRHCEVCCPSHRPAQGLLQGNRRQPIRASPGPQGPTTHILRYRIHPGRAAREPPHLEGGMPGCPLVLECQPLVLGSDPRAAGRTASVACKRLLQVCRTRAWWHGARESWGPESATQGDWAWAEARARE